MEERIGGFRRILARKLLPTRKIAEPMSSMGTIESTFFQTRKEPKMGSRNRFDAKKHFIRTALAALTLATGLALTGCGRQIARVEGHQLELQRLSETNAKQMATTLARLEENQKQLQRLSETNARQIVSTLARLEENQKKLHVVIAGVPAGTHMGAIDMAAAPHEQMKLQEVLWENSQQPSSNVASVAQNPPMLQGQITLAQSNIRKVASAAGDESGLQMRKWKRQPDGAWQLEKAYEK
jgi:TolA-binding protein